MESDDEFNDLSSSEANSDKTYDVAGVLALGDELESQGIVGCRDTVGTPVIGTVQSTVPGACGRAAACGIPGIALR